MCIATLLPPIKYTVSQKANNLQFNVVISGQLLTALQSNNNSKKILIILYNPDYFLARATPNQVCDVNNPTSNTCSVINSSFATDSGIIYTNPSNNSYRCYIIEEGNIQEKIHIFKVDFPKLAYDFTFMIEKDSSSCSLRGGLNSDIDEGKGFCILQKLFESNPPYYNCYYNIASNSIDISGYGNLNYIIFARHMHL